MKDGLGLPKLAWAGLGLLAVSAILLSLGQRETEAFPAIDSYAPSGTSALAELLRKQGYTVEADYGIRPNLKSTDTAIVFSRTEPDPFSGMPPPPDDEEAADPFMETLEAHFAEGGTAIVLPIYHDFLAASRTALQNPARPVKPVVGPESFSITSPGEETTPFVEELYDAHTTTSLYRDTAGASPVVGAFCQGGIAYIVENGLLATNRFIDRANNAAFISELVRQVTPPGGRIVFTEASFGNVHEKGLLEAIGDWANAGWQQFLLLLGVIIYTLGKRLGLPDQERRRQRGSRELVDAVADTMQRTRSPGFAMMIALERANAEIRYALKLPRDADRTKLMESLPTPLQKALVALEAAAKDEETPDWDATKRIQRVDEELAAFLGTRRRRRPRKDTMSA